MKKWNQKDLTAKLANMLIIVNEFENDEDIAEFCSSKGYSIEGAFNIIRQLEQIDNNNIAAGNKPPRTESFDKEIKMCHDIVLSEIGTHEWRQKHPEIYQHYPLVGLSTRTINALSRKLCLTFYDLLSMTGYRLSEIRNIGKSSILEIKDVTETISRYMFDMDVKELADTVCSAHNGMYDDIAVNISRNFDIHDIGLNSKEMRWINSEANKAGICKGTASLYDLMDKKSPLFRTKINHLSTESLQKAKEDINRFSLRKTGLSLMELSKKINQE